jgi:hypothetical protein
MIVVTTSWAPVNAFSHPGMKPYTAPASSPARIAAGMAIHGLASARITPAAVAPKAPIRNWPRPPMLKRPALKPMPTASPARISGVASTMVVIQALKLPSDPSTRAQ